jgi:hypothetical protein
MTEKNWGNKITITGGSQDTSALIKIYQAKIDAEIEARSFALIGDWERARQKLSFIARVRERLARMLVAIANKVSVRTKYGELDN